MSYFIGKSHFEKDGTQNRYLKLFANTRFISWWESKGLSEENFKPPATSDDSLSPLLDYLGDKTKLKFNGDCFKQPKVTYTHRKTVNIYIVYELGASSSFNDDPTLKNSLFGTVKLTKNADIDKYQYSGYGIGFDRKSSFSFPGCGFG